ncbi:thiamine phosphate synthase [Bacillaceae bacterium]
METRIDSQKMKELLKLYFIMGSVNVAEDPVQVLREAIDGGVTLFQFREKGRRALTGEAKWRLARRLQDVCRACGVPFIVNDDVELALRLDADGVHVGQEDEPVSRVREKIGGKILGVSAHNLEEAQTAIAQGADYLGVGPVFPTSTKEDAGAVQGPEGIRRLRENGITVPIVAIGGIAPDNVSSVIEAGADGIAVISAICQAPSAKEAARRLRKEVIAR